MATQPLWHTKTPINTRLMIASLCFSSAFIFSISMSIHCVIARVGSLAKYDLTQTKNTINETGARLQPRSKRSDRRFGFLYQDFRRYAATCKPKQPFVVPSQQSVTSNDRDAQRGSDDAVAAQYLKHYDTNIQELSVSILSGLTSIQDVADKADIAGRGGLVRHHLKTGWSVC